MRRLPLADRLRVRRPCPTPSRADAEVWRDGRRFCESCELDVHDVSLLTRDEAEALLRGRDEGKRACVRIHVRRSDGAILLADGHAHPAPRSTRHKMASSVATLSIAALGAAACASPPTPLAPTTELEIPVATTPAAPLVTATPEPTPAPQRAPAAVAQIEPPPSAPAPAPTAAQAGKKASAPPKAIAAKPSARPKRAPNPGYDAMDGDPY